MQISERCVKLLHDCNIPMLRSNFLMADLEKILYGVIDEQNEKELNYDNYWHKPLSNDMLSLANEWKDKTFTEDLFLILNNNLKQITENDTTKYSAQMIFPFFVEKKLAGFAIFFRTNGDYIPSSAKAPKTIRNFIQNVLNEESDF